MSYKSLLFCPDEKAARLVTQVLSELDFTVEIAAEPFATVKKLSDEHYDALVVDCHNEQDASLLFKAARNSTHNHSSLSVAVVEGQAGVAKAFRIGANLVLTKPINVEQSKGTLRVARGLLKKNEAKTAGASATASTPTAAPSVPTHSPSQFARTPEPRPTPPLAPTPKPLPGAAIVSPEPHIAAPAVPYAGLVTDKDPTPEPEPEDRALLDSMPDISKKRTVEPHTPALLGHAEPIAASTSGQAAAAAPALEKNTLEAKLAAAKGASPMVTNEPIVRESNTPHYEAPLPVPVPTFSTLGDRPARESSSTGGTTWFRKFLICLLVAVAAYWGWQKFQPQQYLHSAPSNTTSSAPKPSVAPAVSAPAPTTQSSTAPAQTAPAPQTTTSPGMTFPDSPDDSAETIDTQTPQPSAHATHAPAPSDIQVEELPLSRDTKLPPATKPVQPLVVKPGPSATSQKGPVAPAPSLIAAPSNSNATIANIVSADVPLPKPAAGTVRVSQGVSQGLLLKKVAPVYPPMALQMHKEGTVQLLATINKDGGITKIKVLSGDGMLARAAVDAVQRWTYRPYLLNGEPVEIETQISIVFKAPQ